MSRAIVTANADRRAAFEPLYDIAPRTGASVEVFYADRVLAGSFDMREGWFWWSCQCGYLPDGPPVGPFATSYLAYRDALEDAPGIGWQRPSPFGRRANLTSAAQHTKS
jgi:hypothetical protein